MPGVDLNTTVGRSLRLHTGDLSSRELVHARIVRIIHAIQRNTISFKCKRKGERKKTSHVLVVDGIDASGGAGVTAGGALVCS